MLDDFLALIQEAVSGMGQKVVQLLPTSPFISFMNVLETPDLTWLKWLNWIVPIGTFIAILQAWLVCVGLYYLYSVILRWVKAIQ